MFAEEDFAGILADYDLGLFRESRPFKQGAVQTNVLLVTSKGHFVFRYYESRSERYARFEVSILQYLVEHGYPCPAPIENIYGGFIGAYQDKPFALFAFLEGEHSERESNGEQIAQAIGHLHTITIGYRPDYYEVRDTYDPESCWNNATSNAKKIASEIEAEERLAWLRAELDKLELPEDLPKGVCHCDTHHSNFLYRNGKLVAVLDFDDGSYIYLLYDIANMIFFWAWPDKGELGFDKARELLRAYEQYRRLTETERRHLYDLLKMVVLMGIGWFIDDDEDYSNSKRKVELLGSIGREAFYSRMFGQSNNPVRFQASGQQG